MQEEEEFRLVTRKTRRAVNHNKKHRNRNRDQLSKKQTTRVDEDIEIDCDMVIRRVNKAELEVKNSAYGETVFTRLKEWLATLNADGIAVILCYGLGRFSENLSSKYQLALLLSLKHYYGCEGYIYDPVFHSTEKEVLRKLGFQVIDKNEEGKRTVNNKESNRMNSNLQIVRSLIKEIRHSSRDGKAKDNIVVQYILEQARAHRETSEILCKAREELKNLAETYHCYLSSARQCKDIHTRYAGKGERSIKETADLVGFKLPHDPK